MNINIIASSSKGNAYIIESNGSSLILEAGLSFQRLKKHLDYPLQQYEGCFISHEHGDHIKAAEDLMEAAIPCYMSQGTAEASNLLESKYKHRLNTVEHNEPVHTANFTIKPLNVEHNAAEPMSFLISDGKEKLYFATDTGVIPYNFNEIDVSYLMLECNYESQIARRNFETGIINFTRYKKIITNHMELHTLLDFLENNDFSEVKEIHLIHLSAANSDADKFKRLVQEKTGKYVNIARIT